MKTKALGSICSFLAFSTLPNASLAWAGPSASTMPNVVLICAAAWKVTTTNRFAVSRRSRHQSRKGLEYRCARNNSSDNSRTAEATSEPEHNESKASAY